MDTATTHATNYDGKNRFVLKKSDTNNKSAIEKCKNYKSNFTIYIGSLDVKRAPPYSCFGETKKQ